MNRRGDLGVCFAPTAESLIKIRCDACLQLASASLTSNASNKNLAAWIREYKYGILDMNRYHECVIRIIVYNHKLTVQSWCLY